MKKVLIALILLFPAQNIYAAEIILESPRGGFSTEFVYQVEKKKDGRTLMIQPRGTDVRQLQFTIYDNGTAYLNVVSNSRQAINFTGYLQTLPVPKQTTNP